MKRQWGMRDVSLQVRACPSVVALLVYVVWKLCQYKQRRCGEESGLMRWLHTFMAKIFFSWIDSERIVDAFKKQLKTHLFKLALFCPMLSSVCKLCFYGLLRISSWFVPLYCFMVLQLNILLLRSTLQPCSVKVSVLNKRVFPVLLMHLYCSHRFAWSMWMHWNFWNRWKFFR